MAIIVILEVLKHWTVHGLGLITHKVDFTLVTEGVCHSVAIVEVQVNTCAWGISYSIKLRYYYHLRRDFLQK